MDTCNLYQIYSDLITHKKKLMKISMERQKKKLMKTSMERQKTKLKCKQQKNLKASLNYLEMKMLFNLRPRGSVD